MPDEEQIDNLCRAALCHIGFGTLTEIRAFWDATTKEEVAAWGAAADMIPVEIECADGSWHAAFACPDIEARIAALKPPTSRLRILNPFDPAIRDRKRLARLFGFEYTVEMFVPAAKRRWGYYVFPASGRRPLCRADRRPRRSQNRRALRSSTTGGRQAFAPPMRAATNSMQNCPVSPGSLGLEDVTRSCERSVL